MWAVSGRLPFGSPVENNNRTELDWCGATCLVHDEELASSVLRGSQGHKRREKVAYREKEGEGERGR